MRKRTRVFDRDGNELPDDVTIVPDGGHVRAALAFKDGTPVDDDVDLSDREAAALAGALAEDRRAEAYAAFRDRVGAGMRRNRVPFEDEGEDEDENLTDAEAAAGRAARAYLAFKKRLGSRVDRVPTAPQYGPPTNDPPWTRPSTNKGMFRKVRKGQVPDSPADSAVVDRAAEAYAARSAWLQDAWRTPRALPHRGPWGALPMDRKPGEPAWVDWNKIPAVGPSGRSPYRSGNMKDAAEQAYNARNEYLQNAWRTRP